MDVLLALLAFQIVTAFVVTVYLMFHFPSIDLSFRQRVLLLTMRP
jgi:hypothetical protein